MPGPEEWRPRRLHRKVRRCTESGLSARFTLFLDESRRQDDLAGAQLGPRRAARLPRHAGAVLDRHLPAGLHRHRPGDRRVAGRDAADALGLPVRLRRDEPVPRRALRQHRPAPGGARRAGGVHPRLGRLRPVAEHRRAGLLPGAAGHVGRRRHRRLPRRHPRHVPAGRRAAGDVAGDDLFRRRAGGGADGRRLPPGARRLALDLLVPHRRRRRPLRRHLAAAAGDAARHPSPAVQRPQPAARLLGAGQQPALPHAGAGQRHPVQRHVPLRPLGAGVPRRAPASRAGRVLLVLRPVDRRDHERRLPLRADGGQGQDLAPDPLRLRDHGRGVAGQPRAQPGCSCPRPGGRCCRSPSIRSAGR